MANNELTEGQKLVGYDFNPGSDPLVDEVKLTMSKLADILLRRRMIKDNSYTLNLLIGAALVAVQQCSMCIVKVITYKY